MFLSPYFLKQNQSISVSAQQASDFAKKIAQDFNPIHDVGAKRFCVPGDLLFALVLTQYGLSQSMKFTFAGMVGDGVELQFPEQVNDSFSICDNRDKTYLNVSRLGDISRCDAQTESFIRHYVAFSGHNFIDILMPLMKQHQVMINPDRPLVIYESMSFDLTTLDFVEVQLSLVQQELKIDGKRGDVTLHFELHSGDTLVGTGIKTLVMSGLRAYEEDQVQQMCAAYEGRKTDF
ncbi:DUF3581 domain-containing protein [Shewanella oneidensis MR-1]|uniref:DUF3581 domain-containing protein n=1 Tax=Shewanella oneidensis (strain ATCC 700550 / JCM 31522 / CIP 106686 / LMG 19005 / NCIMB 14063 / MR-1) TaxID=211586 RepID=Q8EA97_SHEON|nr:DUF3581 domain-containing protein [Shewanella oneidensis]AAN56985.1 protein of unknown function DUF3581 [Shewanella oneidensis MR-1]MDX5998670.1 DUF3581 domain-containing protein [Shewanella oneidensis]MEE2029867.1 hypothetical protein [Shewanella oneidensis]QKG98288.1 DUF3581 domain-containing protein [Shewanella oneidensis MR-1]